MIGLGHNIDIGVRALVWDIVIPAATLIVGAVLGFFGGVAYLKIQMEKMQSNPELLQQMAKKMGYNMNKQQLQKAQQMMKSKKF